MDMHQKQNSQELAELPHLLTSKVLELQQGLNKICAASKGGNIFEKFSSGLIFFHTEAETNASSERETTTEVCYKSVHQ
jgi:hypothetical protein